MVAITTLAKSLQGNGKTNLRLRAAIITVHHDHDPNANAMMHACLEFAE